MFIMNQEIESYRQDLYMSVGVMVTGHVTPVNPCSTTTNAPISLLVCETQRITE